MTLFLLGSRPCAVPTCLGKLSNQIALQLGSPVLNLLFPVNSWNGTSRADLPGLVLIVSGRRRESLPGIPLATGRLAPLTSMSYGYIWSS